MLMLGGMVADKEMRAEDGDILYGVEQKLPLFGRPGLARKVAQADADVATSKPSQRLSDRLLNAAARQKSRINPSFR